MSDQLKKKIKKPKTSDEVQENNEEAARVRKYEDNLLCYNDFYLIFVRFFFQ